MQKFKKSYLLLPIFLLLTLSLPSCSETDVPDKVEIQELPSLTATDKVVVQSANNFSLALLAKVNESNTDNNVFISPFSVSTALAMTLNGANGETNEEIKKILGYSDLQNEEINLAYQKLVGFLLSADPKTTIDVANSNWYSEEYSIKTDFEKVLLDYYDAEVKPANFNEIATKDLINDWIEDNTNGKIKKALDAISPDVVMYLINAIYFKADWTYQFDESKTEDDFFYLPDGTSKMVPMMYSEGATIGYTIGQDFTLIDIPYGNGQFSFTAVMRSYNGGNEYDLNEMAESFSMDELTGLLADTLKVTKEFYMPKFTLDFKASLKPQLIEMGMSKPFVDADFSNLFEQNVSVAIDDVIHQAFLEVNEKGSEAAAITIVSIVPTSISRDHLTLDRSFLFFIRENHTNTILFAGKLIDPTI
jgi:serpin B